MEKLVLTEKSAKVLEILKDNGGAMIASDIAVVDEAMFQSGARSVSPILIHLVKKELVEKVGKQERETLDKDGNTVTREYTAYKITDLGNNADYDLKVA